MMKTIRRILILSLVLTLTVLLMIGCAETTIDEPETEPTETADTATETEPTAKPAEERYIYKHVVLIGVDGAGTYFRNTDTPRIDEIFADSLVTYDMITSNPSISAQSWGAMLTGCTPEIHGFTNANLYSGPHSLDSDAPTVFKTIRDLIPDAKLGSFCTWDALNIGLVEDEIGVTKKTIFDDEQTAQNAVDFILAEKPLFTFVDFDFVDEVGHAKKYGKPDHLKQITITDGYIGQIYDACAEAGILDDTLFIVTADHGGRDVSHGGWLDEEKYIMFAIRGKTVIPHGTPDDPQVRDTAAIILYALGLEDHLPEKSSAHIPNGVFSDCEGTERREIEYTYQTSFKKHDTEPTPEIGSGKSVVDVLGEDRTRAYFTFDRTTEDAVGKMGTEETGKLYYPEGFFGDSVMFDDGYITMDSFEAGKDSFSVCFWVRMMSNSQEPILISNKNCASTANPGFSLGYKSEALRFNVGDKKNGSDQRGQLPDEHYDVWTYAVVTIDRENARVGFSCDFGEISYADITEEFAELDFSNGKKTNIGQDGSGKYPIPAPGRYDEMVLVDGVLTDDDVAALKNVYIY